jgi:hypothetical protein
VDSVASKRALVHASSPRSKLARIFGRRSSALARLIRSRVALGVGEAPVDGVLRGRPEAERDEQLVRRDVRQRVAQVAIDEPPLAHPRDEPRVEAAGLRLAVEGGLGGEGTEGGGKGHGDLQVAARRCRESAIEGRRQLR